MLFLNWLRFIWHLFHRFNLFISSEYATLYVVQVKSKKRRKETIVEENKKRGDRVPISWCRAENSQSGI